MSPSRVLASVLAVALMLYLLANAESGWGYADLTFHSMIVFGWACVYFGDALADSLELPDSWSPTLLALRHRFIQAFGWLSLGVVAALVLISLWSQR